MAESVNTLNQCLNVLISSANRGQERGVYTLSESSLIWDAVQYAMNILQQAENARKAYDAAQQNKPPVAPISNEPTIAASTESDSESTTVTSGDDEFMTVEEAEEENADADQRPDPEISPHGSVVYRGIFDILSMELKEDLVIGNEYTLRFDIGSRVQIEQPNAIYKGISARGTEPNKMMWDIPMDAKGVYINKTMDTESPLDDDLVFIAVDVIRQDEPTIVTILNPDNIGNVVANHFVINNTNDILYNPTSFQLVYDIPLKPKKGFGEFVIGNQYYLRSGTRAVVLTYLGDNDKGQTGWIVDWTVYMYNRTTWMGTSQDIDRDFFEAYTVFYLYPMSENGPSMTDTWSISEPLYMESVPDQYINTVETYT